MLFKRFVEKGLSHFSYVVADEGSGQAVVIDPRRDTDHYVTWIREHELELTAVVETHLHADYASGAHELAETQDVPHYLSAYDKEEKYQARYDHVALEDGDTIEVGPLVFEAVHTPGHTPEHLSYLLYPNGKNQSPTKFFTGDFLFVGSLGRPDLIGEDHKTPLANKLYESVQTIKSMALPADLVIHPAHGSGSLCGAGMDDSPSSTLRKERENNRYFAIDSKEKFVGEVLGALGDFPPYYKRMKVTNSRGAEPVLPIQAPGPEPVSTFEELTKKENNAVIVDLRDQESFGAGHIPGSLNLEHTPKLNMWAPWVLPYETPLYLAGDASMTEADLEEVYRQLIRVELDDVVGYLKGGVEAWDNAGNPTRSVDQLSPDDLEQRARSGIILDVRTDKEYESGHVPGAKNIPVGQLRERINEIEAGRDRPIYTVCGTGYRSSLAASLLEREGFETIGHLTHGFQTWQEAGKPTKSNN